MTMSLVSTITVTSPGGAASIEFTGIPQTGTDLVVMLSGRQTSNSSDLGLFLTVNGDTSAIYSQRTLRGSGSNASSFNQSSSSPIFGVIPAALATANTFGNASLYFPNYAGVANKSISIDSVMENNATESYQYITAGLAATTSAITSLSLLPYYDGVNKWAQYTTVSLYTITKGSGGATVS